MWYIALMRSRNRTACSTSHKWNCLLFTPAGNQDYKPNHRVLLQMVKYTYLLSNPKVVVSNSDIAIHTTQIRSWTKWTLWSYIFNTESRKRSNVKLTLSKWWVVSHAFSRGTVVHWTSITLCFLKVYFLAAKRSNFAVASVSNTPGKIGGLAQMWVGLISRIL
jgi:hypothetical protein